MKRFFKAVFVLMAVFSLSSCSLDDEENFHFVSLKILEAELPEYFVLNETYTIEVTFERMNGCVYFEYFEVQPADTTVRNVVAIGTELEDTGCTQAIEEVVATFDFIVLYEDTYTFRFFNGFDENDEAVYIEYQVEVRNE